MVAVARYSELKELVSYVPFIILRFFVGNFLRFSLKFKLSQFGDSFNNIL